MKRSLVGDQRGLLSGNAGFRKLHASKTTMATEQRGRLVRSRAAGIRRSLNLIFRLWVGRWGRWNGPIAFGLLSLGLMGKFQPRRRQV